MTECPVCQGRRSARGGPACGLCGGAGELTLTACPRKAIGNEALALLEYAELYAKGLPPVAGGALDQAIGFTAGCRFVWAEQDRMKARIGRG